MIIENVTQLIGNTPLLKIPEAVHGLKNIELYAKLELFNPWGSVKDRTAWGILKPHQKELQHKTVIESSSGNTAKALQIIASMHGSTLKAFTNRIRVDAVRDILQTIGVDIVELPGQSDCYDPNDPNDPTVYIQNEIRRDPEGYIYSDQYRNDDNRKIHYETTGEEIIKDLSSVDYLIGGLGTSGSTRGVAEKLAEHNPELKVCGVVAEGDDYLPGLRTKNEVLDVGLFNPKQYDKIMHVASDEALEATKVLVNDLGVLAGPTSGAALHAATQYLKPIDRALTEKKRAVFIVCDRLEWYTAYIKERKPEWFGKEKTYRWQDVQDEKAETEIAPEKADAWIAEHDPLIIDTRNTLSFAIAHMPNAINIPLAAIDSMLQSKQNPFPLIKRKILFVCPVGNHSHTIARHLCTKKTKAFSLRGGITAYQEHGGELIQDL